MGTRMDAIAVLCRFYTLNIQDRAPPRLQSFLYGWDQCFRSKRLADQNLVYRLVLASRRTTDELLWAQSAEALVLHGVEGEKDNVVFYIPHSPISQHHASWVYI